MKRLTALFAAVIMTMCLCTAQVSAQDAQNSSDETVIWLYTYDYSEEIEEYARNKFIETTPSSYRVPDVTPDKFKLGKGFSIFDIDNPEKPTNYFYFPVLLDYGPVSAITVSYIDGSFGYNFGGGQELYSKLIELNTSEEYPAMLTGRSLIAIKQDEVVSIYPYATFADVDYARVKENPAKYYNTKGMKKVKICFSNTYDDVPDAVHSMTGNTVTTANEFGETPPPLIYTLSTPATEATTTAPITTSEEMSQITEVPSAAAAETEEKSETTASETTVTSSQPTSELTSETTTEEQTATSHSETSATVTETSATEETSSVIPSSAQADGIPPLVMVIVGVCAVGGLVVGAYLFAKKRKK